MKKLKKINIFIKFNNINEIFNEIKDKIYENKIIIKENENDLLIILSLPQNNEIFLN